MDYQQVIQPNTNIAWVDEECLMDVREAFRVGSKYPTAMANWNANSAVNHPGATPPSNIAVPIFFSIPSVPAGHVCLWDNGMIYTSSAQGKQIFTSIQALINWMNEGFKYLGWSEEIESTRVVEPITSAPPVSTGQTITLPASTGTWHLYNPSGPYNPNNPADVKGILNPAKFGGLTYNIDASLGNGVYRITTQDFGVGDIWTNGSQVIIK